MTSGLRNLVSLEIVIAPGSPAPRPTRQFYFHPDRPPNCAMPAIVLI
jgi:hypothetical protein